MTSSAVGRSCKPLPPCDTIVVMISHAPNERSEVTIQEAIRQHKAGVRRVGKGKPYNVSQEAQDLYKLAFLVNKYGIGHLNEEELKRYRDAGGE